MLVVANWKAYVEDLEKAKKLFSVAKRLSSTVRVKMVLAPPAPYLGLLAAKNSSKVAFAAQDLSSTTGGPHTGEITAPILKSGGVSHVLVGHSERRALGEEDALIAKKIEHAIAHGLIPILCVGEAERDPNGEYLTRVREQIVTALTPLDPRDRPKVVVAYEPIWAIGKSASEAIGVTDLSEMTLYIRKVLAELYPGKVNHTSTVL